MFTPLRFERHNLEVTMNIETPNDPQFNSYYAKHCKYLRLKGLQPKTVDAYSRAIRRIGNYFNSKLDDLTLDQFNGNDEIYEPISILPITTPIIIKYIR